VNEYLSGATIHGFSQLSQARHVMSKIIWLTSIISTIAMASYMIYYCNRGWEENPIITSVAQIPIESITFPPVTVCPLYSNDVPEASRLSEISNITDFITKCSFRRNGFDEGKVCNRIQLVTNEQGYCFTFNNVDITLLKSEGPTNVPGVGKNNGLQLVMNPEPNGVPVKYRIFISEIGTTYSKVYFDVRTSLLQEVNFDIHGLHYVQAGPGFADWNKGKRVCYFPDQKELFYFSTYMQANCRLECAWNRTISECGCAPKSYRLKGVESCTTEKMSCWRATMSQISNEPEDPKCECKNDCEMTHFFYAMRQVGDVEDQEYNSSVMYFHFDTHIITQINIQLRLSFFDKVASIGGMLGLFSGISIISVIEIVFYLSLVIVTTFLSCSGGAKTAPMEQPTLVKPISGFYD